MNEQEAREAIKEHISEALRLTMLIEGNRMRHRLLVVLGAAQKWITNAGSAEIK